MKNHQKVLIVVAVLILGLAGWRFWSIKNSQTKSPFSKRSSVATSVAKNAATRPFLTALKATFTPEQIQARTNINAMLYRNPRTPIPVTLLAAAGVDKGQIIKGIQDAENLKPINVYGKVVDQHGEPVPQAQIHGGVLLNDGADKSKSVSYESIADDNGRFNFTGLHGVRFGLGIEKKGYDYNPGLYLTWWDNYKPDSNNPAVFVMWKLQGAEPMMHAKIHDYIPCDGTEIHYDLLTGKRVNEGGDLIVTLTRDPVDIERGKPFSWKLSLQVQSGGFIAIHDPYPYLAPDQNYVPSLEIARDATEKNWSATVNGSYYVKARGGQVYARVTLNSMVDFQPPPTLFNLDIYSNPSGSRNLEFDGAREIKSP